MHAHGGAHRRARQLRLDQHWVVGKSVASNTQGTKNHMIAELFEAVRQSVAAPCPFAMILSSSCCITRVPAGVSNTNVVSGNRCWELCMWMAGWRACGLCMSGTSRCPSPSGTSSSRRVAHEQHRGRSTMEQGNKGTWPKFACLLAEETTGLCGKEVDGAVNS